MKQTPAATGHPLLCDGAEHRGGVDWAAKRKRTKEQQRKGPVSSRSTYSSSSSIEQHRPPNQQQRRAAAKQLKGERGCPNYNGLNGNLLWSALTLPSSHRARLFSWGAPKPPNLTPSPIPTVALFFAPSSFYLPCPAFHPILHQPLILLTFIAPDRYSFVSYSPSPSPWHIKAKVDMATTPSSP